MAAGLDASALVEAAEHAVYVGSPEHKSFPSFAGPPRLRSDATKCPTHLKDVDQITRWLREAITNGQVSDAEPGTFPKYVWCFRDGTWFEGRLVNAVLGQYKGYPLVDGEQPTGIPHQTEGS